MAKLDVKVLDMEDGEVIRISYKGEEYVNIGTEGNIGDIALRVNKGRGVDVDVGSYYATALTTFNERFGYINNNGDAKYHTQKDVFVYFRKEAPKLDVGDIVRIVKFLEGANVGELVEVARVGAYSLEYKHHEAPKYGLIASVESVVLIAKASDRKDR